ncbi:tRNA threonylcarbamoyladenosine biosynthesis protein TsaE [Roseivirga ehrenbergii]|uniref:tRNA threonylcarbamoyladenosine biosynthesis protein TsaE n=1 Tax=Roseivirga ehrenbergii (strain DSM 102268 / JCM 13514 / KCTC 12282 / NCIMB 14502 / KMM 6017) TaxID=279360 RepID=A0A150XT84_ROSEK|nr:tRNA (adenosine(37)-N6)-threonylcarbamoyltransferase complex ATPase subunit type 1 TsaE [Roseivirga ehrenbergii]KYG81969.1 tRNA threonylcarbamoyladenosine biosynthesis protein TsaE [Roseivirga ehrenbergii]TCL01787.1 tRNA threonylcarbamoyladenosine biosynthesis protein TsaE [Roseivirga ehrenbergii]
MTTELRLESKGLNDLENVAQQITAFGKEHNIWLLMGQMGAGKTTLSKAICNNLGVMDLVQSPTFSLVNEYLTNSGRTIYHFDFYRIEDIEELANIGVEEYFDSGNLCLIEWPEKISELIPDEYMKIFIEVLDDSSRVIKLTKHD